MIFEKVKGIIAERLEIDEEDIALEDNLESDLDMDSLDIVEMAITCEEEFGIEISDNEIEKIRTVGDLVKCIEGVKA